MNHVVHRTVDIVAALVLITFLGLEYGGGPNPIPERLMSFGDATLHIVIFADIAWHVAAERFGNGHAEGSACAKDHAVNRFCGTHGTRFCAHKDHDAAGSIEG